MHRFELWTDGACAVRSGAGGWAAVIVPVPGIRRTVVKGHLSDTTNNRMELMAVIEGLRAIPKPAHVKLYCDSAYVVNAVTKGWLERWVVDGWLGAWSNGERQPIKNQDLWRLLLDAKFDHAIDWVLIRGHSGLPMNELADQHAVEQSHVARKLLQTPASSE